MHTLLGVLAALGSCALWAYSSSRFQVVVRERGPFATSLFKVSVGALLSALTAGLLLLFFGVEFGSNTSLLLLAISGLLGMAFGDYALFLSMRHLGVRQAMLLHGTAPLFLLFHSLVFAEGDLKATAIAGILLVVFGISLVVIRQGRAELEPRGIYAVGVIAALLAALGQAAGILLAKEAQRENHVLVAAAVRLVAASFGLLLLQTLRGRLGRSLSIFREVQVWQKALVPTFLGTFLGVALMMVAISRTDPAVAGALLATTPLFLIPISARVLGLRMSPALWWGTAITVLGVASVSVSMG